jgi:two-component system chemotaxis sensor kinase CheA
VSEAMPDIDMDQFRDLFVAEGQEHVHTLNRCMLALEQEPGDAYALNAMFRAAHSLKGMAATMGFDSLASLAHAAEDALHQVRDGNWALASKLVDLLFVSIDTLQAMVDDVASGGSGQAPVGEADMAATVAQLRGYEPAAEEATPSKKRAVQTDTGRPREPAATMIRLDVRHLDTLLDIVTEMVIHRSLLNRLAQRHTLPSLDEALRTHERLLAQLQGTVLSMRMMPIGHVFDRFPRMVRDLLKTEGKKAELVIEGREVELDRTALDLLGDPLMHLLRNAIDHGLETPEERKAAGKPPTGTLHLSARQERESVIIEVKDDGKGIDAQRVADAAVERGIVTAEVAAEMSTTQKLDLICHPGFSLSEKVTAVSGRGVGMNVVKQQLEALHGSLQIETVLGQGTTFRLQLPAMLAMVRALLVRVGREQYALPSAYVEYTIEIEPEHIEHVGKQELYDLGTGVLPLRHLGELLAIPERDPQPHHALIVQRDGKPLGLCVDDVLGHEEIVVKPLPQALRGTPGLSGVTILGEGQVVLILDVTGL